MHSRNEFNCIYNHIEHAYRYGCHVTREVDMLGEFTTGKQHQVIMGKATRTFEFC